MIAYKMWTNEQIKNHKEAAKRLKKIVDLAFLTIRENKNILEKEVQDFVYQKIKELRMVTDKINPQIVAFGLSSAMPHYHPTEKSNKKIKRGDIVKIDVWARLKKKGAPFADITWMGYCGGNVPKNVQKIFDIVIGAREEGVRFIKKELKKKNIPLGKEVDKVVRDYIHKHGFGEKFIHGTGHSLGLHGPHGSLRKIRQNAHKPLHKNVAYTIEPGIYLEGKFGIRSEIDFFINDKLEIVITTALQKKIIRI